MAETNDTGSTAGGAGGIDGIVRSVDHALTSMDPKAGAAAVEQVLQALGGAPGPGGIGTTLQELHGHLQGGAPDGARVGPLLTALGRQTRDAAGQAGGLAGPLQQLAARLDAAGSQLSGGRA